MKLVIYSVVLNQHQAPVADELWKLTNHEFCFVELTDLGDMKGGSEDYSKRPYLLRAWDSAGAHDKAMELARTAECCIFSGIDALPYENERLRQGLLSFDMSERILKRGIFNYFSPYWSKWIWTYFKEGWKHKPLYKLCMSAFAARDNQKIGMFVGKAYKWGYFTFVPEEGTQELRNYSPSDSSHKWSGSQKISEPLEQFEPFEAQTNVRLMWCARFLMLKHPELPVEMTLRLKAKGYKFVLDFYGSGDQEEPTKKLVEKYNLEDVVKFHGNVPNSQVIKAMQQHSIFLFTSDSNEGWGAVANESLSCGCALVGSDAIGSIPYLVQDGVNGYMFRSCNVEDLTSKMEYLLNHPAELRQMQINARRTITELWNPKHAAESLLQLIDDLQNNRTSTIKEGPCSKA